MAVLKSYLVANCPHYTLNVPPALPGALNMAQPEYSWAQSLAVAMHSVKLAFGDNVTDSEVSLEVAVDELDSFRRQHNLVATTPSSKYYLASCRVLHSREVTGTTMFTGWRQFVTGEPMIRNKNIVVLGDSGSRFCPLSGKHKSAKCLGDALRSFAGHPNIHDLTEVGAHPMRWIQLL
ncbi:MAG: hypothetical protein ACKPKO_20700 [Candidatus Fonsibacter sp.]